MKNIIKPGYKKPNTKPIYEATCSCGCKFEFDDDEITKRTRNLHIPNTIWVECPCCGKELEINNPKVVREEPIRMAGIELSSEAIDKITSSSKKMVDAIEKTSDIYALGKIVLLFADDPAAVVSSDNLDNKISFNVDITSTYNCQHFYDYYNLIYKIFRNNGFYRKELIDFINDNEKNAAALVKKKK